MAEEAGRPAFTIGGEEVAPGKRSRIEMPVARLPVGTSISLGVEVVHGRRPGPVLWLSGGIHGDELDGVEIIRRVLDGLRPDRLRGTVVGVPIVNLYGALNESRYLPDRRDLNRSFPGSAKGSLAGQLAHLLMKEVVGRCRYGIDFHCGSDDRDNLPQIRCDLTDDETRRLGLAFAAPVTLPGKPPEGSLRKAAVKVGARVLLYEGGEAWRFTPEAIEVGIAGTFRVLRALDMLPPRGEDRRGKGEPRRDGSGEGPSAGDGPREDRPEEERRRAERRTEARREEVRPETLEATRTQWLRAGRSGVCRIEVALGQRVEKGEKIAVIRDLLGGEGSPVRARTSGLVIGRRINPLIYRGEAVAHVAIL